MAMNFCNDLYNCGEHHYIHIYHITLYTRSHAYYSIHTAKCNFHIRCKGLSTASFPLPPLGKSTINIARTSSVGQPIYSVYYNIRYCCVYERGKRYI